MYNEDGKTLWDMPKTGCRILSSALGPNPIQSSRVDAAMSIGQVLHTVVEGSHGDPVKVREHL